MQIDRHFKGFDDQRVREVALADVGALSITSSYFEGVEPLHFDRNHSCLPFFVGRVSRRRNPTPTMVGLRNLSGDAALTRPTLRALSRCIFTERIRRLPL